MNLTASGARLDWQAVAAVLDHTLLKADATDRAIEQLCHEAVQYGCASVCVSPVYVQMASKLLAGSKVAVGTVIGFPSGAHTTRTKLLEAEDALRLGARELDMVIHIGRLKAGPDGDTAMEDEIRALASAAHSAIVNSRGAVLKVILETPLLTDAEIVRGCRICVVAGADFVKTATGFAGPATIAHVRLMSQTVGATCGVKASGGVRTAEDVRQMMAAGASRIGTSSTVAILTELGATRLA